MLAINGLQCDRCLSVVDSKTRRQGYKEHKYMSVRSWEHRNKLKDYCPSCYATLEFIGRIRDGKEYPKGYTFSS